MISLLRVSDEAQTRIITRVGVLITLVVAVAVVVAFALNSSTSSPKGVISVAIETPYVGQGVTGGTALIMHGVKVGEVTDVANLPGGQVRLTADLQSGPTAGLTDTVGVDFRPANYFGVTGINLIPGEGGVPLRGGAKVVVTPKGNFALQALLYRLGELSDQVVTPQLISVIERATRYTDALNPLLETLIIVSRSVNTVQTVSTEQLLRNTTGLNVAFPGFVDALVNTGDLFLHSNIGLGYNDEQNLEQNPYVSMYDAVMMRNYDEARHLLATDPDYFVQGRFKEWLMGGETDLFAKVGKLLSSHIYDLFPVVEQVRVISDVVPQLVPAQDIAGTLAELRTRLERMYAGSGDQRALQVRVILNQLPGIETPMNLAIGAAG